MKKIIIVVVIVLVIGGFLIFQKSGTNLTTENGTMMTGVSGTTTPIVGYKDGTYTGSMVSASQYGDMQVKVIITGGKITDVQFVQYPTGFGHTAEVTQATLPILKREVISAQSANINIVSGATQDTEAFAQSVQSALDQAVN